MENSKKSNRQTQAEKLYSELLKRGIVQESEKSATKLLTASCRRAYEDTRPTPKQKKAYIRVDFEFISALDMAIYFITELPNEWEKWKAQTEIYNNTKNQSAKKKLRPTVDRIFREFGYERNNLQMLPHAKNTRKDRCKPCLFLQDGLYFVAETRKEGKAKLKATSKNFNTLQQQSIIWGYRKVSFKNEAQHKRFCDFHGLKYLTPESRMKRDIEMIAKGLYIDLVSI